MELENWLGDLFTGNNAVFLEDASLQYIVRECHQNRNTRLELLKSFIAQGQTRGHEFEQLYKLLCKLGKHVKIARKLVESAVALPQDFNQGFFIEVVPSSKPQKLPLLAREGTVESTAGRMFSNEDDKNRFLARLESLWKPDELSERSQSTSRTTKTRVHAELLLINYFDMHGCNFLGGSDRYIGCSKPACYLCYAFITNHPGRYATPATHQKIYLAWRLPEIYSKETDSHERHKIQEDILSRMTLSIRRDLEDEMDSRRPRRPFHADSTAGVTSTLDASTFSVTSLMHALPAGESQTTSEWAPLIANRKLLKQ